MTKTFFKTMLSVLVALICAAVSLPQISTIGSAAIYLTQYNANVDGYLYTKAGTPRNDRCLYYSFSKYKSISINDNKYATVSYNGNGYWTVRISGNVYPISRTITIQGKKANGQIDYLSTINQEGVQLSVSRQGPTTISALARIRNESAEFKIQTNSQIYFSQFSKQAYPTTDNDESYQRGQTFVYFNGNYTSSTIGGKAADYGRLNTYTLRYDFPNIIQSGDKSFIYHIAISAGAKTSTDHIQQLPLKYEHSSGQTPFDSITLKSCDNMRKFALAGGEAKEYQYYGELSNFDIEVLSSTTSSMSYKDIRFSSKNGLEFFNGDDQYETVCDCKVEFSSDMSSFTIKFKNGIFGLWKTST